MSANNQLPTEQRNDFDIVQNIPISLKHLVKYKNGTAIYFLSRLYNNFNYHKDKKQKNKIFVELLRAKTKDVSSHENYYFQEISSRSSFSDKFEFVDFDALESEDRWSIVLGHDIQKQFKVVKAPNDRDALFFDENKWKNSVETSIKTMADIDLWIETERARTEPLHSEEVVDILSNMNLGINQSNGIITNTSGGTIEMSMADNDWQQCVLGTTGTTNSNSNEYLYWDANRQQLVSVPPPAEPLLPITPMQEPNDGYFDLEYEKFYGDLDDKKKRDKTVLLPKRSKKKGLVVAKIEKTRLL